MGVEVEVPSSLKFFSVVGLGGGVKFFIYFLEGGGATWKPLWLHPWSQESIEPVVKHLSYKCDMYLTLVEPVANPGRDGVGVGV